tara:strand:+ start:33593 stop:33700 length:108 start_codon:yes stop_codon:yes gene_type:complete
MWYPHPDWVETARAGPMAANEAAAFCTAVEAVVGN